MKMKRLILVLLLCAAGGVVSAQEKDSLLVMFWNVENFFDWTDQGFCDSDKEFSSFGERHWTKSRFYSKCDAIAKSIMWIGDRNGRMPDVIALAEVENKGVLTKLLNYTLLRKYDYSIIHKESQDRRGIDVALLYRNSSMSLVSKSFKTPLYEDKPMMTRDILHVEMKLISGETIDFIVNHHPSKYGGNKGSELRRISTMSMLKELYDSLGRNRSVVMGDFNDIPSASQFNIIDKDFINQGILLHRMGEGSIRYKGKWELIDFFLTSPSLEVSPMQVVKIPFLMTYDKSYPGEKPLRTYSGPRYVGGVSDHCPIIIRVCAP